MAIKGSSTIRLHNTYNFYLDFNWERTNFSQSANTSTIKWEIVLRDEAIAAGFKDKSTSMSLNIDGVVSSEVLSISSTALLGHETITVSTGTRTITHNADGNKDFNVDLTIDNSDWHNVSLSDTFTLDRITKASSVTCSTVNIGESPIIRINRQASDYKHTLIYAWYGDGDTEISRGYIAQDTTNTIIDDFTWSLSFYKNIPNSKSGHGYIYCNTYLNGYLVGEQSRCNFTVNANEYATPTFQSGYPIVKDINSITKALTNNETKLIRYASTAEVTVGAQAQNYATMARYKVMNGNAEPIEESVAVFTNVESGKFSFELEDSRGFVSYPSRDETSWEFIEYFHPTCNLSNDKPDASGSMTLNCSGSWFNASFGATHNTINVQYRWKKSSDNWLDTASEWKNMTVVSSGNNYNAVATFVVFDPNTEEGQEAHKISYDFQARATDKLFTANSVYYPAKSAALFSWSKDDFEFNIPVKFNAGVEGITSDGSGEATGDLSQYALKSDIPTVLPNPYGLTINGQTYDGTSAVAVDVTGGDSTLSNGGTINGDLTITGDLRLKGTGNYGNKIYMGDGSYVSFSEDTDDDLTIKATDINLNGNVYVNGSPISSGSSSGGISGTWTPSLNSSAISSYTIRQGWYQQVGNVVTLGFNIKATCNSGYNNTSISITGLPITPRYDASGGGMCSGAYVSAGFNFECWVASTNGKITGRVQACNNTIAANIATSASGLFYRNDGGEITLGGTICYIIN